MLRRETVNLPSYVYPADPWRMVEKQFYPRFLAQMETIFSVSNGYLGLRGACEEGRPAVENGTFINGFYESWPIVYGEEAYGFAKTGQTIVNVTDSKIVKLYVDDEPFYLPTANLLKFERVLDLRGGSLDREVLWETPAGKRVSIKSRRLVSFEHRHLAAIAYEVTVLNGRAAVDIVSEIRYQPTEQASRGDPRKAKGFKGRVLLPRAHYRKENRLVLSHETKNSKMTLACGVDHQFETACSYSATRSCSEDLGQVTFSIDAQPGIAIQLVKYMTYHTSRSTPPEELCDRGERTLNRAANHGFAALLASQKQYLEGFWNRSDVQIEGDPSYGEMGRTLAFQQAIRFNLFQTFQASVRAEGTGIPAKGLTGQAYEGQYFWDTEIYLLPFLTYTTPRIAKNLLKFRYSLLDKARQRAREMSQKGALFPWRTINGEEASAYYAAGTAQYHINADIIYALKKYVQVSGDEDFLFTEGVEMLVETARMWFSLGYFSERKGGQFCIDGVTGPDEYNTVVNNNIYTNLMAQENLRYAAATVESLQESDSERFAALLDRTGLAVAEVADWKRAADAMYLPFDEALGIYLQHDGFLDEKVWDFETTPADKYPLLLHFHPLVIYRHQVVKQADIVLAMFLLGQKFSTEEKKRTFDYYDPLTTGDSSLSVCIQSIVAFELGYFERARDYAYYAVLMDLGDIAGNVTDGCHIASMGGTWMVVVYGIGGMRDYDGCISFNPRLPKQVKRLRFPLTIRGQQLEVDLQQDAATYLLKEGSGLTVQHQDREIPLSAGVPVQLKIEPQV